MTTEMTITMNPVSNRHEIRYHDPYCIIIEDDGFVRRALWEAFMKLVGSTLAGNENNYCLFRFLGYRVEPEHDMVLEYELNVYNITNYTGKFDG